MALPTLLHRRECWVIRENDKSRIRSAELKFMRTTTKYTRKNYKTNEAILSELKINSVVKKIQNYINKWVQGVLRMDTDRRPHLIMKYHQPRGKRGQG